MKIHFFKELGFFISLNFRLETLGPGCRILSTKEKKNEVDANYSPDLNCYPNIFPATKLIFSVLDLCNFVNCVCVPGLNFSNIHVIELIGQV